MLTNRLKMVADFVEKTSAVADIGTDHAYIPIYIIKSNITSKVIAMDINKGPLKRAEENIKANNLKNKIETRLSNGLEQLSIGEVHSIIISGMGGMLIKSILLNKKDIVKTLNQIIVQPQSDLFEVRKTLHSLGFYIKDEKMIKEENKYYVAIDARKGLQHYDKEVYYKYGKQLIEQKSNILKDYLNKELKSIERVIQYLTKQTTSNVSKRIKELNKEKNTILEVIQWL